MSNVTDEKGLRELCAKIAEDSHHQEAEVVRKASEKAAARMAEARREGERVSAGILRQATGDAALESKKILSRVQLETRKAELRSRETLIGETLARLRGKISALPDEPGYTDLLKKLALDGAIKLGGGEVTLMVAERDRKLCDNQFMKSISDGCAAAGLPDPLITLAAIPLNGVGVLVRGREGRVEVNNTLEARIARMSRELRMLIADILFGGE
ncbi:MAG: V-type ATP synthase subunit E family protein [Candidatus Aureabacteria bacterium]|nr:V-type ATP synthase subunit E family protein [Candidatus Auribacterota bacterium]